MSNPPSVVDAPTTPDTREALTRAARRLIERQGWSRTTLAGIARDAGLTTGAIYSQFRGADHLLLETILTTQPRALPFLEQASTLEQAIRTLVIATMASVAEPGNRNIISATAHLLGALVQDDEIGDMYREHAAAQAEAIGAALEALASAEGSVLRGDARTAAHTLGIIISGLSQAVALDLQPMDVEIAVAMTLDAIRLRD